MKKFLSFAAAAIMAFTVSAADNADLFKLDEAQMNKEFQKVNEVEQYVDAHQGMDLDAVKASNSSLVATANLSSQPESTLTATGVAEGPLGIPSFIWGCILGWVGILIVYLITEDSDETKKALFGCLAWTAVAIIFYIVYFILILGL